MPIVAPTSITPEGIAYWLPSADGKGRRSELLRWSEIVAVDAFKRDLFSYDLICLQIWPEGSNAVVEFDEEGSHWQELMAALPKHLPGCRDWHACFSEVAHPAFATNLRRLYERKSSTPPPPPASGLAPDRG